MRDRGRYAVRSTNEPRGSVLGGAAPPGGAGDAGGGVGDPAGAAAGPRAYCVVPGDVAGRAGGAAGGGTENADKEEVDNMAGIMNRIR